MALWLHSKWGATPVNSRNYLAIRDREISAFRWNQVGNPPDSLYRDSAQSQIHQADPRANDWLFSSDQWNKSFPEGWEPVSVLGAGGFGIAGHWRYVAAGPHKIGDVEREIRDIVVKQASAVLNKGLISEAFIMEMLTRTGSRHFPQIYGRVHLEVRLHDRVAVDQKRREVHRIFMEYCEYGSLAKHINDSSYRGDLTDEPTLWSWFHCLSKAVMVMERGHEEDSESRFSRREPWGNEHEVVHFDLKPDNALVSVTDDYEHVGARRVVISDFGLSQVLPNERNGPHKDHDKNLDEYEDVGTVIYRAPEQLRRIPRPKRRLGACTNIFQVGVIMFCLIMQTHSFPYIDPPTRTRLTRRHRHRTMGGEDLEMEIRLSRVLRGLIAECLHLDPAFRPTSVELVRRTRAGLKNFNPWGATSSKIYGTLKPVDTLMLDGWFGKFPSTVWPKRIPEMEEVVNLRRRQRHQVDLAINYDPQNPATANNQGGNLPGGPATGQNPPPPGNQGPVNPPGGPAAGQNPPTNNNQPRAPPAARARWNVSSAAAWDKFTQPADILDGKGPRKSKPPPGRSAPSKQPDWGKVVKNIKCPPAANIPRSPKRPTQGPEPEPKRSRRSEPVPIRQIDMMNSWLHDINLNRPAAPVPQLPTEPEQTFLIPVRIWPGPLPNPADEAVPHERTFVIPMSATLKDLLRVMMKDRSSGVALAVRCRFAKARNAAGTALKYAARGPGIWTGAARAQCASRVFPQNGYADVSAWGAPEPTNGVNGRMGMLSLKVGYQMTILTLKKAVIDSDMRPDFRFPSQLMFHYGGDDPQARDFPDYRTIKSFFEG
ncbi:hypothetical protein VE04_08906 [Pseudogymnoascus sp. 24MN13]|nr:hypothetical protein VE04_08906 [Pseudogymnoascus sp. 24MN13]